MVNLSKFWAQQRGAVAVIYGLALLPILGLVGAAVDYSLAQKVRSNLQSAADATALAAASLKDAADEERLSVARAYLAANFSGELDVSAITIRDGRVQVELSQTFPTLVMGLLNFDTITAGVVSEAVIPETQRTEIALVLDYSGSMNQSGKYQTMRDSSIELIEELLEASNGNSDGRLQIGLVPFSEVSTPM